MAHICTRVSDDGSSANNRALNHHKPICMYGLDEFADPTANKMHRHDVLIEPTLGLTPLPSTSSLSLSLSSYFCTHCTKRFFASSVQPLFRSLTPHTSHSHANYIHLYIIAHIVYADAYNNNTHLCVIFTSVH